MNETIKDMLDAAKIAFMEQAKRAGGKAADVLEKAARMSGELAVDALSGRLDAERVEAGLRKIGTMAATETATIAVIEQREFVQNSIKFGVDILRIGIGALFKGLGK